jgi:hypothetical protein
MVQTSSQLLKLNGPNQFTIVETTDCDMFWAEDGKMLVSAGADKTVRLRETTSGKEAFAGGAAPCRSPPEQALQVHADPAPVTRAAAVMVLEQIGTVEARELLEKLSKGAEGMLLTEQAKAAMDRLKR